MFSFYLKMKKMVNIISTITFNMLNMPHLIEEISHSERSGLGEHNQWAEAE